MIDTENTDIVGVLGDLDAADVLASIKASPGAEQAEAAAFFALGLEEDEPTAGEGVH